MDTIVTSRKLLEQECAEVIDIQEGLQIAHRLLSRLVEGDDGIGLAANQIGINKKICVLRIPEQIAGSTEWFSLNFINPIITEFLDPIIVEKEGCLSFPNDKISTLRYNQITVLDSLEPKGRKLEGWRAICCEHEVDHLYGITMHDRRLKNIRVNELCPCGSKKKFKKCCSKIIRKIK